MSEAAMMERIRSLEEELRVLHAKDSILKIGAELAQIANSIPMTKEVAGYATLLLRDLDECTRREQIFYLRKENGELRQEVRKLRTNFAMTEGL